MSARSLNFFAYAVICSGSPGVGLPSSWWRNASAHSASECLGTAISLAAHRLGVRVVQLGEVHADGGQRLLHRLELLAHLVALLAPVGGDLVTLAHQFGRPEHALDVVQDVLHRARLDPVVD